MDGGWGEVCESYCDRSLMGCGTSTASQTSWALLSLFAAGEAHSKSAARELEVHPRTIHRDFVFLRDSWGAPLEFSPKRNGYYYRDPPVVYGTPYGYGYNPPPVIYGPQYNPGFSIRLF